MDRIIAGVDCSQVTLFPDCLKDWIDDDNPVHAVDAKDRWYNIKTEMALSVLAYNLNRVMNGIGMRPLMEAIHA